MIRRVLSPSRGRALSPTRGPDRRFCPCPLPFQGIGQFVLGSICGILIAGLVLPDEWSSAGMARVKLQSALDFTLEELEVQKIRREVAEKTIEVLQGIALSRGSKPGRCSAYDRSRMGALHATMPEYSEADMAGNMSDLKIYVYNLPPDFNTNMLDPQLPRKFDCRQSMYGAEVLLHERMLNSKQRTEDPAEADLFYVPVYMSCYRSLQQHAARVKLRDRVGILRGRGLNLEVRSHDNHMLFPV